MTEPLPADLPLTLVSFIGVNVAGRGGAQLAAMRADVQSNEVAVARRALSLFVRRVDVDADRLVIWYHEPALMENARLQ